MSALGTPDSKSIFLLIGVVTVGAVFIIAIALLSGRRNQEPTFTVAQYSDEESGIVFKAPTDWQVGTSSSAFLRIRSVKIDAIQAQRSTCTNYSPATSKALQLALQKNASTAAETWKKEFPGLRHAETLATTSGTALLGVDTCNASLTRKVVTLRGQAYQNDTEVRFELTLTPTQDENGNTESSSSSLNAFADTLVAGTNADQQDVFSGFVQTLRSIE